MASARRLRWRPRTQFVSAPSISASQPVRPQSRPVPALEPAQHSSANPDQRIGVELENRGRPSPWRARLLVARKSTAPESSDASEAGHRPESLRMSIHALGYVADTDQRAADEFFPGYAQSFTEIAKERGWPPVTHSHYEAVRGANRAMLVSQPARVVERILVFDEALGGGKLIEQETGKLLLKRPLEAGET